MPVEIEGNAYVDVNVAQKTCRVDNTNARTMCFRECVAASCKLVL